MAKLTEIVVAIEAEGVDSVLNALSQVEGAQAQVAQSGKESAGEQKQSTASLKTAWHDMATGINQAMGIARQAIQAGKAVYNFSKEGAQLDFIASKFDRLSESVGTTSSALLVDLRAATAGTMSDAELMSSATDFMSLGLAGTHDEVVRLTGVAGELGMNMNQLVLALTNQSTMRFDQLGLSVAGFDEKVKALEASGMSVQEAFTEAFLQQAEEQIEKVGSIADTSAGQVLKLEASFDQIGANMKQNFSDQTGGVIGWLGNLSSKVAETGAINRSITDMADAFDKAGLSGKDLTRELQDMANIWGNYDDPAMVTAYVNEYGEALEYVTFLQEEYGMTAEEAAAKTQELIDKFGVTALSDTTDEWAEGIERVGDAAEATGESLQEVYTSSLVGATVMSEMYGTMATDWKSMRTMAEGYDEALGAISASSERIAELEPFKDTGGVIDGVWMSAKQVREEIEALEGASANAEAAMERMAAQMTLSMMQASMEIDGYTESEIDALTQYMVDAGLISEQAAEKMKQDYTDAINTANRLEFEQKVAEILADTSDFEEGLEIVNGKLVDKKTGEILADITDFMDGFTEADLAELDPKIAKVLADILPYLQGLADLPDPEEKTVDIRANYIDEGFKPNVPNSVNIGVNYIPNNPEFRALGGTVYPGQEYVWQEPGREGELLLPEQYGRVMSNREVAQMFRDALLKAENTKQGSGQNTNSTSNRNVTYNVNATYKGEPILTLSDHLRILSTLEGGY